MLDLLDAVAFSNVACTLDFRLLPDALRETALVLSSITDAESAADAELELPTFKFVLLRQQPMPKSLLALGHSTRILLLSLGLLRRYLSVFRALPVSLLPSCFRFLHRFPDSF